MQVNFLPYNKTVNAEYGDTILKAAIKAGIMLNSDLCNSSKCGKCKVIISKGNDYPISQSEKELLTEAEIKNNTRLACFFKITKDIVVICFETSKIYDSDKRNNCDVINSEEKIWCECNYNTSDLEANNSDLTDAGVAIDLGTTTIEAVLVDLNNKCRIGKSLALDNPQQLYGMDVISRITYCNQNEKGLDELNNSVISGINTIISDLLKYNCVKKEKLSKIIITGNTVMIHLLLKKEVTELGKTPFDTGYRAGECLKADKIGLNSFENVNILLPGIIGGHVGSDTYSCEYYINSNYDTEDIYMIVDIGTNGEVVLYNKGIRSVCSTAAGPAFEGSLLSCAVKNSFGAINKVIYDDFNNISLEVEGIGVVREKDFEKIKLIRGFSGSGIVDLTSYLLDYNIIDSTGLIIREDLMNRFPVTVEAGDERISYKQKDIRNVQLAKSAIKSAIERLLSNNNVNINNVYKIYIAGAFGKSLNIKNAINIGLLPDLTVEKYIQVGNAALLGAVDMILNDDYKNSLGEKHYELALDEEFSRKYIDNMNFLFKDN